MTAPSCADPIPLATLLEYWLGELDAAREGELDGHLLGCSHCSASLQSLVDLAGGVGAAVRAGALDAVLSDAFVQRLAARGLRLRQYHVPHNGSVHCTVAPDDDLLITRLAAPLLGIERLDLERVGTGGSSDLERLCDVPFDAAAGEVVFTLPMQRIRALPETTVRIRLIAPAPSGERLVGEYTLHHRPYQSSDGH
ncbi:MAG TPA: hypothetical protein VMK32_14385 [Burkholderiaceae bacterium]|nr:hypothetical protein [Burkholderiaceae bacterium]